MPTHDRRLALDAGRAEDVVARAITPPPGSGDDVGLEVEFFPIVLGPPTRRVLLDGAAPTVRHVLGAHGASPAPGSGPCGTAITVEPGGQVEVVTACCPTPDDVLDQATRASGMLSGWFDREAVVLAAAGIDLWHDVGSVPQQLQDPRYPAMADYFAARGPDGATMMRHTCALQLTLDLGTSPAVADERWMVANLLAPLATATFATSPSPDHRIRSARSLAWQHLDATRTGFPARLLADDGTLVEQVSDAALDADVLLMATAVDASGRVTRAESGRAGWTFGAWMQHGHPEHGWPTADDLRYHLTTLFHEVRARGPVEIRSIDALPHRWRAVPVVLYAGALFDPAARSRILEVLEPHRADLPDLLRQAATTGVSDPSVCALAVEAWSFALGGARRLPGVEAAHVATTEAFVDRFTVRGRCPADELAEAFRHSPAAALDLVREPVPSTTGSRR